MLQRSLKPILLGSIATFIASACGSSDSNDSDVVPEVFPTGGNCVSTPGSTGNWEVTDLAEASQWTRLCADSGALSIKGKYLRIENLQLAEGETLTLMPFSRGADNGFSLRFSHDKLEAVFAPLAGSEAPAPLPVDLTEAKTFCIEIHDPSEESHIIAYIKGTDAAVCSGQDVTDPTADWDVEVPASENLAGNLFGYTASANVQVDKIVLANRVSGTEAGNPTE